jgi:DNA-binding transcriptional MerR regulator
MHVSERLLRVGEVAKATGLTVRALHHYDEIGLLVPSGRSEAGYRLYSDGDVARLYRILALRAVGFTLDEIGEALGEEGGDPLRLGAQPRDRLTHILDVLDRADEPSADLFIDAIEVMTRMDRYYTPEQRAQLQERADALGEEGLRRAEDDWARLIAEVDAERVAGTDPADPRLTPLVERWTALIEQFTGGDPGIHASLNRLYETEGPERASRGALNSETMEYARRAIAARAGG